MPYVKIWVHLVWSTKNREPYLVKDLRQKVIEHITDNASEKGIVLDTIGGHVDHIHLLISLKNEQTISKIVMLLKGESSFWINKNKLLNIKFEWQEEYFAVSVSESIVEQVRKYILNQEEHHRKKSYAEECREFLSKYGFTVGG